MTDGIELVAGYTFLDLRLRDYTSAVLDATGTLRPVDFAGKLLPAVPQAPAHRRGPRSARGCPGPRRAGRVAERRVRRDRQRRCGHLVLPVTEPGAGVEQVPFRAVPARALVHLNAAWRLGPATLFGSVENLFGLRYAGTVVANEILGRFYEAGPPASVSLGLKARRLSVTAVKVSPTWHARRTYPANCLEPAHRPHTSRNLDCVEEELEHGSSVNTVKAEPGCGRPDFPGRRPFQWKDTPLESP